MILGGAPAFWFPRTHNCATLSITEVEYVAMENDEKEEQCVRKVLSVPRPRLEVLRILELEDNQGVVALAEFVQLFELLTQRRPTPLLLRGASKQGGLDCKRRDQHADV